jgi:formiminotetrahydrofolate cyclodeaminase
MSEKIIDKSCVEFTQVLSSKAPVPGGGGVSALVGAFGAALCSMAGNLTLGRKKYAAVEDDIRRMLVEGAELQRRLLELVDEDALAFEPLSRAYSIPKEDPTRSEVLERVTVGACQAPLEMMRCCCRAIELLEEMKEKGSVMLISDVGCGAICCRAALESASLNIFINTKTLTNRETAAALEGEADTMLSTYLPRAENVAQEVTDRLRGRV